MSRARLDGTPRAQAARAAVYAVGLALCLAMALLSAAAVEAQTAQPAQTAQTTRPARPYRGLFGQQDDNPKRRQSIDFTMALSEGYDNSGSDQPGGESLNVPFRQTGVYSNLDGAVRYTRARRDRRFTVTAGTALRYYPAPYQLLSTNYRGAVSFTSPVWRGGHVELSQGVGYTPYYQLELFPALPLEAGQTPTGPSNDYAIWKQPAYTYTSAIQFVQKFSARSALRLDYDRRSVMFSGAANDLLMQGGSIRFTRQLTRYAGFHAGVGSRVGQYSLSGGASRTRANDIDLGVDYNRPISFSRKTTLNFSSGSSLIPEGGKTHYRVTGNVSLSHQIARAWRAGLQYDRALRFVEGFPQPFFSDSIAARMMGNPSRRIDLVFSGGYSAGAIGVSAEGGRFGTYTGSGQMGISMNRHFAFYSEYIYYHYRFGQEAVAAAFLGRLDRQTARVGLKLWFPLLD